MQYFDIFLPRGLILIRGELFNVLSISFLRSLPWQKKMYEKKLSNFRNLFCRNTKNENGTYDKGY
jgi:hypothetical protein